MNVFQSPSFVKKAKKLHKNHANTLDKAIEELIKNPLLGELKKGDLSGIRVYQFYIENQLTLLAYTHYNNTLQLKSFGTHENFYRGLKKKL